MPIRTLSFAVILIFLTGCGLFGAAGPEPTATPAFAPVPTFTPTAVVAQQSEAAPDGEQTSPADGPETTEAPQPVSTATAQSLLPTPTRAADTPAESGTDDDAPADEPESPEPQLTVSGDFVNVRQGPGVDYPIVGSAQSGEVFTPTGGVDAGDWWQICCFGDQPGWIFAALVEVQGSELVALVTDIPPAPTPTPAPVAAAPTEAPAAEAAPVPVAQSGTAGSFDPAAQYHIVGYRVVGYGENNGGIFNNGGQHMIFIKVIDGAGNGVDGAVVKNAINDNVNIVTGAKGPGKAEFEMFWDPYKLYVASDPSGPVTSQITNQMNTAHPHIPDIIGRLGPVDEEYAICPTPEDWCEPPFFHAHWSYEVVFQRVN